MMLRETGSSMIARSAMAKMLCSSWVTTTKVKPRFAQRQDGAVEIGGGDGIEAGRRLIQHQDVASQRHGAGDAGALEHSAGRAPPASATPRAPISTWRRSIRAVRFFSASAQVGELIERKADVFQHGQRTEQRAALVHDPRLRCSRAFSSARR